MRTGVEIKGMKEVQNAIKNFPQKLKQEADMLLAEKANDMVNRAVADAPVDVGFLKNQITMERQGEMNYRVVSGADWSVYIEFGTRQKFNNPYPELSAFVSSFKGSSGKGKGSLYQNIVAWAKRKGIAPEAVFPIYKSILINGIHPHPFFFKNYFIAVREILDGIREMIKTMK